MDTPAKAEKVGPVVALLSIDAPAAEILRTASALAREKGADLDCLTVDTGRAGEVEEGEARAEAQRLARSLGARVASEAGTDEAAGLLKYAAARAASCLVVDADRRRLWGRSLADRLRGATGDASVIGVAAGRSRGGRGRKGRGAVLEDRLGQYTVALLVVAAMTGLNLALAAYAGYWAAAITYLAAVSLSALFLDRRPVILATLLSALAWDYFFIPPRFTMLISRTEDILMLGLYLVVAVCSGWMTGRLRASERILAAREGRLSRLNALASTLAGTKSLQLILDASMKAMREAFGAEAIVILGDGKGGLRLEAESGWEALDASAREAALEAFQQLRSTGRFTSRAPSSEWHFLPLEEARGCLGVIGLRCPHDALWNEELEAFLRTMALTVAMAAARELA